MAAKSSEKGNSQNHQGTVNTVKNYVDKFLFATSWRYLPRNPLFSLLASMSLKCFGFVEMGHTKPQPVET